MDTQRLDAPKPNSIRKSKSRPKALIHALSDASDAYTGSCPISPSTDCSDFHPCSPLSLPAKSTTSMSLPIAGSSQPLGRGKTRHNPREAMRLAKLALMHEEVQEAEGRRERRRTRRASSLAVGIPGKRDSRKSNPLPTDIYTIDESALDNELSPTAVNLGLHSILRAPPVPIIPEPESAGGSNRSSVESLAPPIDPLSTAPELGARRRSSRVRFSEDPLPSANSSPPLPSPSADNGPVEELQEPSRSPTIDKSRLSVTSSLSHKASGSSLASVSSSASDPFGLQCTAGSPVAVTPARTSTGSEDAFTPRDLPYRRLSKVLERLHTESEQLDSGSSEGSSSGMSLREIIDRPSVGAPGVAPVAAPLSLPMSTLSSFSSESISFGPSARSSACTNSLSVAADLLSRDNSVVSGTSSISGIALPPRLDALAGAAYASLLPSMHNMPLMSSKTPLLNRQPWLSDDMGLSPRSGPSPVTIQSGVMLEQPVVPDLGERPEAFKAMPTSPPVDLKLPEKVVRTQHADSIDMLPVPQKQHSLATQDAFHSLGINRKSEPSVDGGMMEEMKRGHQRQGSDFTVDMAFPLPPDRANLSVTLADRVKPGALRRKATLSPPVDVNPAHALVEEYFADDANRGSGSSDGSTPRAAAPASPTSALSFSLPSMQSSPCPDAYSLSHVVMQVGNSERSVSASPEFASPESQATPRVPDSPKLEDMIEQTLRARRSTVGYNFGDEDSDLDTATPLEKAPAHIRTSSSNTRLSRTPSGPRSAQPRLKRLSTKSSAQDLKAGVGLVRNHGWSGSESEEEDWASTIRSVAQRRTSKPALTTQSRMKPRLTAQRSLPSLIETAATSHSDSARSDARSSNEWDANVDTQSGSSSATSDVSGVAASTSSSTTMTGTDMRTPSDSLNSAHSSDLRIESYDSPTASLRLASAAQFPWSGLDAIVQPIANAVQPLAKAVQPIAKALSLLPAEPATPKADTKRRASGTPMPKPTRDEEWGEPEVMIDEASDAEGSEDGDWYWDEKSRTLTCESRTKALIRTRILVAPSKPANTPSPTISTPPVSIVAPPSPVIAREQPSAPLAIAPVVSESNPTASIAPVTTETKAESPVPTPASANIIPVLAPVIQTEVIPTPAPVARPRRSLPIPPRRTSRVPIPSEIPSAPRTLPTVPQEMAKPAVVEVPAPVVSEPKLPVATRTIPTMPEASAPIVVAPSSPTASRIPTRTLPTAPQGTVKPVIAAPTSPAVSRIPTLPPVSRIPTLSKKTSLPNLAKKPTPASPLRTSLTIPDVSPPTSKIPLPSPKVATPSSRIPLPTPSTTPASAGTRSSLPIPGKVTPPLASPKRTAPVTPPKSPARKLAASPIKRTHVEPTTPRPPSPEADTLQDFVARARATRKANTPSPTSSSTTLPMPAPNHDDTAPPASLMVPRQSLGARLAELIAKRDAAAAAGLKGGAGAGLGKVEEAPVPKIEISQADVQVAQEWKTTELEWNVEVYQPVLAPAPMIVKGKQRQIQEPTTQRVARRKTPQAVCTAGRFF